MNPVLRPVLALAFSLLAALPASAKIDLSRITPPPADKPIPIEDFFRPFVMQQAVINPAGTHIAAIASLDKDLNQLLVFDMKTKEEEVLSGGADKEISRVGWVSDSRVMFLLTARKRYHMGLLAANVGRLKDAYPLSQYFYEHVIAIPAANRNRPLVWMRSDIEAERDLGAFIIDTERHGGSLINLLFANAEMKHVIKARENHQRHVVKSHPVPQAGVTYRYLTDREGNLGYAFNSSAGEPMLFSLVGKDWVRSAVDLEEFRVVDCGNEPGQLAVATSSDGSAPGVLCFMDAATGGLGETLHHDPEYDFVGSLYRRPSTNEILGAQYSGRIPTSVWFDSRYRGLQAMLDGSFPGSVSRIIGSDDAETVFLVATFSDRQPVLYNWVRPERREAGLFNNTAPWIDPKRMRPMSIVKFKTADGRTLDAYLTLPEGASKENPAPLVVLPHGGPYVRDDWGFNGEVQFLASRGYAVLQPNYRGSPGYGWMFTEEEEWDFLQMHGDVTAATKTLIASKLVDPDRIAIMGGSFGAYLALMGVTGEPDFYRCAILTAGVFDWELEVANAKFNRFDSPEYEILLRKLGDPKTNPGKFEAISPGRRVDRIRVPVFVAGGKQDKVVEITQSKRLISALEKSKVPHETFIVLEEGHGMAHLDNQVELYGRVEKFLAKHMAPRAGQ